MIPFLILFGIPVLIFCIFGASKKTIVKNWDEIEEIPKKTKFRQSVQFNTEEEQKYYDECREQLRIIGMRGAIRVPASVTDRKLFWEIAEIARKDYMTLLFDPHGLRSGF